MYYLSTSETKVEIIIKKCNDVFCKKPSATLPFLPINFSGKVIVVYI